MKKLLNKLLYIFMTVVMLASLSLTALTSDSAAEARTIVVFETEGDSVKMTKGTAKEFKAKKGVKLFDGYTVSTGKESYSYLKLDEESLAKMDEKSKIKIGKLSSSKLSLSVLSGSVAVKADTQKDGDIFEVGGGNAALTVRGTLFIVEYKSDGNFVIYMLDGGGDVNGHILTAGSIMTVSDDKEGGKIYEVKKVEINETAPLFVLEVILEFQDDLLLIGLITEEDIPEIEELIKKKKTGITDGDDPPEIKNVIVYYDEDEEEYGFQIQSTTQPTTAPPPASTSATGLINAGGNIIISALMDIPLGDAATLPSGSTLTIANGGALSVDGTLNMSSGTSTTVASGGMLSNNSNTTWNIEGNIVNEGTIDNGVNGIINIKPGGTLNNQNTGTLNNENTINIQSSGALNNNGGAITNNNIIDIHSGGTLNNYSFASPHGGSYTGMIYNSYIIDIQSGGVLDNYGEVDNTANGTINISGGTFNNNDTLTNNNIIDIQTGGTLYNAGIFNFNGTFINNGAFTGGTGAAIHFANGRLLSEIGFDIHEANTDHLPITYDLSPGTAILWNPAENEWTVSSAYKYPASNPTNKKYYLTYNEALNSSASEDIVVVTAYDDRHVIVDIQADVTFIIPSNYTVVVSGNVNYGTIEVCGTLVDYSSFTNEGDITFSGGEFLCELSNIFTNNGTVVFNGGEFNVLNYQSIINASTITNNGVITFNDSGFTAEGYAEIINDGEMTFNGGNINYTSYTAMHNNRTLNINTPASFTWISSIIGITGAEINITGDPLNIPGYFFEYDSGSGGYVTISPVIQGRYVGVIILSAWELQSQP